MSRRRAVAYDRVGGGPMDKRVGRLAAAALAALVLGAVVAGRMAGPAASGRRDGRRPLCVRLSS